MATRQKQHGGKRVRSRSYPQNRAAYRTYSQTQRGRGEEKKTEKGTPESRSGKRRLWRLSLSALIFVAVVTVKLASPLTFEPLRGQLLDWMGGSTDFVAVFSALGRAVGAETDWSDALSDAYVAVFGTDSSESGGESSGHGTAANRTDEGTVPDDACMTQKVLGFAYDSPLTGAVNDAFGYREHPIDTGSKFHYGLDIQADEGAVIACFADGTVTAVGESSVLGKYLTIRHENGYSTLYAHCSRITASSGQQVRLGDPVAEVGKTGQATGAHLHFELLENTTYLNPIYYVTGS